MKNVIKLTLLSLFLFEGKLILASNSTNLKNIKFQGLTTSEIIKSHRFSQWAEKEANIVQAKLKSQEIISLRDGNPTEIDYIRHHRKMRLLAHHLLLDYYCKQSNQVENKLIGRFIGQTEKDSYNTKELLHHRQAAQTVVRTQADAIYTILKKQNNWR